MWGMFFLGHSVVPNYSAFGIYRSPSLTHHPCSSLFNAPPNSETRQKEWDHPVHMTSPQIRLVTLIASLPSHFVKRPWVKNIALNFGFYLCPIYNDQFAEFFDSLTWHTIGKIMIIKVLTTPSRCDYTILWYVTEGSGEVADRREENSGDTAAAS